MNGTRVASNMSELDTSEKLSHENGLDNLDSDVKENSAQPDNSQDNEDQLVSSPESLEIELQGEEDDDGTETGSEEDDDEESEEEDEEPALKYERLGGSTNELLQKDSASALAYAKERIVRLSLPFPGFCSQYRLEGLGDSCRDRTRP